MCSRKCASAACRNAFLNTVGTERQQGYSMLQRNRAEWLVNSLDRPAQLPADCTHGHASAYWGNTGHTTE